MFARKSGFKLLLVVVGTLVLAGAFYAFAAANTVDDTTMQAGSGSGTISGYSVTDVIYAVNVTTPTIASSVTFELDGVAETVTVRVDSTSNDWYTCTDSDGVGSGNNVWLCSLTSPEVLVADMDSLAVVAYESTAD